VIELKRQDADQRVVLLLKPFGVEVMILVTHSDIFLCLNTKRKKPHDP
jgi:hypothetical protein